MRKIYYETNYGCVKFKLKSILEKRKMTIYGLSKLSGIKYDTIKDYYNNANTFYSFEAIAKICYVLDCNIEDLIEYSKYYSYN